MNLENLNNLLTELNEDELMDVDGGCWWHRPWDPCCCCCRGC